MILLENSSRRKNSSSTLSELKDTLFQGNLFSSFYTCCCYKNSNIELKLDIFIEKVYNYVRAPSYFSIHRYPLHRIAKNSWIFFMHSEFHKKCNEWYYDSNVICMNAFDICIDTQKLLRTFLQTTAKDVTSSIFLSQTLQKSCLL